jgi:uncharacterized protein YqeY
VTGSGRKDQIQRQMTDAMKAGDKVRVDALRLFLSAIRYREVEVGHELSDDDLADVAAHEVKKRRESIEAFDGAGRTELADRERAEMSVLEPFAPAQMDPTAVDGLIDEAFAATGATSIQDLGKVMGYVMGKAKGRVDGGEIQRRVRARLDTDA